MSCGNCISRQTYNDACCPVTCPKLKPFDIAARYVPSFELGGDFYDVIDLDGHIGIAIGDVVGKGIAASLLMASVRASLRAYAQDVYDLDEIIARVNNALNARHTRQRVRYALVRCVRS